MIGPFVTWKLLLSYAYYEETSSSHSLAVTQMTGKIQSWLRTWKADICPVSTG
jgi:hypothetical protein